MQDPDTVAQYTVKVYQSKKDYHEDGTWQHNQIILRPETTETGYEEMVFEAKSAGDLTVIAELVAVLG